MHVCLQHHVRALYDDEMQVSASCQTMQALECVLWTATKEPLLLSESAQPPWFIAIEHVHALCRFDRSTDSHMCFMSRHTACRG
jgi:hypothetical protein